jgi:hypothetical protein
MHAAASAMRHNAAILSWDRFMKDDNFVKTGNVLSLCSRVAESV